MKITTSLLSFCLLIAGLSAQPLLDLERATLSITYMPGAQLIEFSSVQDYQSKAIFDAEKLSPNAQAFIQARSDLNWEPVQLLGFADNRHSLRYLANLEQQGWLIVETRLSSQSTDPGRDANQNFIYQLKRPADFSPTVTKEKAVGVLGPDNLPYRAKIIEEDGQHWIQLEAKVNNREWVPVLFAYGILPASNLGFRQAFRFMRFEDGHFVLGLNWVIQEVPSQMTYRFYPHRGDLFLASVEKQVGEPCGQVERAKFSPSTGRFQIQNGSENCSLSGPSSITLEDPSYKTVLVRRTKAYFSSFVPAELSVSLTRGRGHFVY